MRVMDGDLRYLSFLCKASTPPNSCGFSFCSYSESLFAVYASTKLFGTIVRPMKCNKQ